MIRRAGIIAISLISIVCMNTAMGQGYVPTPVEVSSEKVKIKGEIFIVHQVVKGQTLYSISKAYGVSLDDIHKANPALKDGLKTGSVIYIPAQLDKPADVPEAAETPAVTEPAVTPQVKADGNYKKYSVKWYETIYDVSQRYGVPVDALLALNGLTEDSVLKKRQVLLIPDSDYIREFNQAKRGELMPQARKDFAAESPADTTDAVEVKVVEPRQRSYKISLVLPFNSAKGADSAATNQMDFYAGALLAFEDFLEESHQEQYKLNVVDLSAYQSIPLMLMSGILDDSEIIIGPIYTEELSPVVQWADGHNIPVVSPLDPRTSQMTESHQQFFQFPPAQETLMEVTFDGVASEVTNTQSKPLVIYEKWTARSRMVNNALNSLYNRGITPDTLSYGILEGRGIDVAMLNSMDTLRANTVFVVSENEAFVSDVLRNLLLVKGQRTDLDLSLYGMPKWRNFEVIETSNLHDLDIHLVLQYNIDYTDAKTAEFVSDFRYNYKTNPTRYAFQGYDITSYFLSALHEWGREFPAYIHTQEKSLLQSNVRFEKAYPSSGFTNKGVRKIHYTEGWSVKPW